MPENLDNIIEFKKHSDNQLAIENISTQVYTLEELKVAKEEVEQALVNLYGEWEIKNNRYLKALELGIVEGVEVPLGES